VGEQYGRSFEKPLVATTGDYSGTQAAPKGGSNGGTADGSGFRVAKSKGHARKGGHPRRMAVYTDNGTLRLATVKRSR
jgi:hypothetical protein